jgi:hypothetical protein
MLKPMRYLAIFLCCKPWSKTVPPQPNIFLLFLSLCFTLSGSWEHRFKIRSVPAGQTRIRSTRNWNWVGLKKKQGKKKSNVTRLTQQVDSARLGQKSGCNPLTFIFTKTTSFWFFKKKNLLERPNQNLKSRSWIRPVSGPDLKTMNKSIIV